MKWIFMNVVNKKELLIKKPCRNSSARLLISKFLQNAKHQASSEMILYREAPVF